VEVFLSVQAEVQKLCYDA